MSSSFVLFVFVQKRFYFCNVFNFGYGLQILSDRLLKGRVCFKSETVFENLYSLFPLFLSIGCIWIRVEVASADLAEFPLFAYR